MVVSFQSRCSSSSLYLIYCLGKLVWASCIKRQWQYSHKQYSRQVICDMAYSLIYLTLRLYTSCCYLAFKWVSFVLTAFQCKSDLKCNLKVSYWCIFELVQTILLLEKLTLWQKMSLCDGKLLEIFSDIYIGSNCKCFHWK